MLQDKKNTTQELVQQFPTFVSNRNLYEKLTSEVDFDKVDFSFFNNNSNLISIVDTDGEKAIEQTIDSYFLSSIANAEGLFQVGDKLYKINRTHVLILDSTTKKELSKHEIVRNEVNPNQRDATEISQEFDDCSNGKKE